MLYPFTALYTYRWWVSSQKNPEQRAYNLHLWRHLFSRELLWSNTMVVKLRRVADVAGQPVAGRFQVETLILKNGHLTGKTAANKLCRVKIRFPTD